MNSAWTTGLLCASLTVGCATPVGEPTGTTAGEALSSKCAPSVPSGLQVPDGNKLEMRFDAIGVQIYACAATSGSSYGWVFQAPQATLYNEGGQVAGTHYAGPTWAADDGSTVVGAKVAAYTADPSSIPWLLLRAVSHSGDGRMTRVSYVQRLNTVGGKAPATGCDAAHVGGIARVDYTATYYFYEESEGNGEHGDCE
jgi:hypothetical protein